MLERFSDLRILYYEDTTAVADFGLRQTPVVRLMAMKHLPTGDRDSRTDR